MLKLQNGRANVPCQGFPLSSTLNPHLPLVPKTRSFYLPTVKQRVGRSLTQKWPIIGCNRLLFPKTTGQNRLFRSKIIGQNRLFRSKTIGQNRLFRSKTIGQNRLFLSKTTGHDWLLLFCKKSTVVVVRRGAPWNLRGRGGACWPQSDDGALRVCIWSESSVRMGRACPALVLWSCLIDGDLWCVCVERDNGRHPRNC